MSGRGRRTYTPESRHGVPQSSAHCYTAQRSQQIQRMGFLVISLCATAYAISRIGLGYTVGGSSLHPAIPPAGQRPYPTLAVVPFVWHIGVLPPCLCATVSGVDQAVACHADGTTGLPGAWDRACPVPGRVVMVPAYGTVRQLGRGLVRPVRVIRRRCEHQDGATGQRQRGCTDYAVIGDQKDRPPHSRSRAPDCRTTVYISSATPSSSLALVSPCAFPYLANWRMNRSVAAGPAGFGAGPARKTWLSQSNIAAWA